MKRHVVLFAAAALLLTSLTASAQTGQWTAVGSTGALEPTQVPLFGVIGGTRLGFNPLGGSSAGTLVARFNVTNTFGGGIDDTPPWTTLEVGALNTVLDPVSATLYRVNPCTGARTRICTATNNVAGSAGACVSCTFPSTTFNFATSLYYVEVSISRTTGTGTPELATLRIR